MSPFFYRSTLFPAGCLCAVVTPFAAASRFPETFDFRHRVITNLASWRDNPDGHRLFGIGFALAMVLLTPLPGYAYRHLGGSAWLRCFGRLMMWVGIVGGLVLALESAAVAGMRDLWGCCGKAHEIYAITAFAGLGLGSLYLGCCAIQTALRGGAPHGSPRVVVPGVLITLTVVACLLQLLLYLLWSTPGFENGRSEATCFLNFALWEWCSAACILLLMIAITLEATRETPDQLQDRHAVTSVPGALETPPPPPAPPAVTPKPTPRRRSRGRPRTRGGSPSRPASVPASRS